MKKMTKKMGGEVEDWVPTELARKWKSSEYNLVFVVIGFERLVKSKGRYAC